MAGTLQCLLVAGCTSSQPGRPRLVAPKFQFHCHIGYSIRDCELHLRRQRHQRGRRVTRFPVRPWSWIEGNRIVYSASLGGDSWDLWEVAIAPETGTVSIEPRRLTTGSDLQASASIVRGTQLVFSSLTQTINVWAVPLRTNSGRVLGRARRVPSTFAIQWWPSVSEDGRRLGFRAENLGTGGLWMRDLRHR